MKKEFLDFLYEQRALVQADIDRIVEIKKQPLDANDKGRYEEIQAEERTRRSQIQGINKTIEKYLETHTKNI